jgi:leucyl-tRNA synthetase
MGVPAHDERDREFSEAMHLGEFNSVIDEDLKLTNSEFAKANFNGLAYRVAAQKIVEALEEQGAGKKAVTYKLRDWLFARQRYWGEPVPVIHVMDGPDKGKVRLISDDELPLELPNVEKYEPTGTGESPLASVESWLKVKDPLTGANARRETDTMPGSAASSWYFLRYMDPDNLNEAWGQEAEKYWKQVDFYMGGSEHAVGHLLYSRFWHKVFFDLGLVSEKEPFKRLYHQGMMLGEDGEKMSKSRGNVVNPDKVIESYGADTLRLFEMFLGPIDKSKPWQTNNIEGVYRFLSRYWRFCTSNGESLNSAVQDIAESEWPASLASSLHRTIKQVAEDIEGLRYNTAISAMMILVNELSEYFNNNQKIPRSLLERLTIVLSPFAPHLCEEVWQMFGNKESIALQEWPTFDATKLESQTFEVVVQINGKKRDSFEVEKAVTEEQIKELVLSRETVVKWLEGKPVKKFIYVKEKLVSVVV